MRIFKSFFLIFIFLFLISFTFAQDCDCSTTCVINKPVYSVNLTQNGCTIELNSNFNNSYGYTQKIDLKLNIYSDTNNIIINNNLNRDINIDTTFNYSIDSLGNKHTVSLIRVINNSSSKLNFDFKNLSTSVIEKINLIQTINVDNFKVSRYLLTKSNIGTIFSRTLDNKTSNVYVYYANVDKIFSHYANSVGNEYIILDNGNYNLDNYHNKINYFIYQSDINNFFYKSSQSTSNNITIDNSKVGLNYSSNFQNVKNFLNFKNVEFKNSNILLTGAKELDPNNIISDKSKLDIQKISGVVNISGFDVNVSNISSSGSLKVINGDLFGTITGTCTDNCIEVIGSKVYDLNAKDFNILISGKTNILYNSKINNLTVSNTQVDSYIFQNDINKITLKCNSKSIIHTNIIQDSIVAENPNCLTSRLVARQNLGSGDSIGYDISCKVQENNLFTDSIYSAYPPNISLIVSNGICYGGNYYKSQNFSDIPARADNVSEFETYVVRDNLVDTSPLVDLSIDGSFNLDLNFGDYRKFLSKMQEFKVSYDQLQKITFSEKIYFPRITTQEAEGFDDLEYNSSGTNFDINDFNFLFFSGARNIDLNLHINGNENKIFKMKLNVLNPKITFAIGSENPFTLENNKNVQIKEISDNSQLVKVVKIENIDGSLKLDLFNSDNNFKLFSNWTDHRFYANYSINPSSTLTTKYRPLNYSNVIRDINFNVEFIYSQNALDFKLNFPQFSMHEDNFCYVPNNTLNLDLNYTFENNTSQMFEINYDINILDNIYSQSHFFTLIDTNTFSKNISKDINYTNGFLQKTLLFTNKYRILESSEYILTNKIFKFVPFPTPPQVKVGINNSVATSGYEVDITDICNFTNESVPTLGINVQGTNTINELVVAKNIDSPLKITIDLNYYEFSSNLSRDTTLAVRGLPQKDQVIVILKDSRNFAYPILITGKPISSFGMGSAGYLNTNNRRLVLDWDYNYIIQPPIPGSPYHSEKRVIPDGDYNMIVIYNAYSDNISLFANNPQRYSSLPIIIPIKVTSTSEVFSAKLLLNDKEDNVSVNLNQDLSAKLEIYNDLSPGEYDIKIMLYDSSNTLKCKKQDNINLGLGSNEYSHNFNLNECNFSTSSSNYAIAKVGDIETDKVFFSITDIKTIQTPDMSFYLLLILISTIGVVYIFKRD